MWFVSLCYRLGFTRRLAHSMCAMVVPALKCQICCFLNVFIRLICGKLLFLLHCRHILWSNLLFRIHDLQLTTSMAIETAGQRTAKVTKIRIENVSTLTLPKDTDGSINKVLDFLPVEQYRGIERIKLVDYINDP